MNLKRGMKSKARKLDLSQMPVQPTPCKTCPFNGDSPIWLEPEQQGLYVEAIVTLQSQHLCHSAENKKLCRGGRTLLLRSMFAQGLIHAPTDEAFTQASNQFSQQGNPLDKSQLVPLKNFE
jgi:hypothetical protein